MRSGPNSQNKKQLRIRDCRALSIFYAREDSARHNVIRVVWVSAKFGTCTVVSVKGTLVEDKMCVFTLESTHLIFNKFPIYTHDGASAKFSINSHETDYSAVYYKSNEPVRCTLPIVKVIF